MEEVIDLAKKHSLEPEFHEKADTSLNYISDNLGLTKDEVMLLAFFFEQSSRNRIWISSIADMINVSNIRIISMMNIADDLIKKGYLTGKDNGKDEKYYSVPINVAGKGIRPQRRSDRERCPQACRRGYSLWKRAV